MPSTFTPRAGLEMPAPGDLVDAWGPMVNANMARIDRALDGVATLTAGTPRALSDDEARARLLRVTGSGAAAFTLPSREHIYLVRNDGNGDLLLAMASGTSAALPAGARGVVYTDGANTHVLDLARGWTTQATITVSGGTALEVPLLGRAFYRDYLIRLSGVTAATSGAYRFGLPDPAGPTYRTIQTATNGVSGNLRIELAAAGHGRASALIKAGATTSAIDTIDTRSDFVVTLDPAAASTSVWFDWGGAVAFTGGAVTVMAR